MGKKGKKKQFPGAAGNKPKPSAPKSPSPSPSAPATPVAHQAASLAPPQGRSPSRGSIPPSPLLDSLLVSGSPEPQPLVQGKRVPMEYRAQVKGRCQRQRINKPKDPPPGWRSHAQQWADEWVVRIDASVPYKGTGLRLFAAQIDWRLISNSGVDEGFIRPVIGAGGWPIIPGSGIKGLFRRACPADKVQRWCGSPCASDDLSPGLLRFHGAWPSAPTWTQGLLDVAHPQQEWQVVGARGPKQGGAFALASLYRPNLQIGISSTDSSLSDQEWQEIEATLRRALKNGIGGRTCVGYGSSGKLSSGLLFHCSIEGQGPAAKLLDNTPEFRPTMFRAAIRGMALRLFGGLCDEASAKQVVNRIFGSVDGKGDVSLLATAYTESTVDLGSHGRGGWEQPIYATSGQLQWRLTKACRPEEEQLLADLLAALHGLTMSLGGFGRGWRRPDHRIFFPDYGKTPIGCHWQWRNPASLPPMIKVQSAADLSRLLTHSRTLAERWLKANARQVGGPASWREVIHPQKMWIWSRRASGPLDAVVIHWFHRPKDGETARDPRDLRKCDLAGRVNQVGRIWNRLLPLDGDAPPRGASQPAANPLARPNAALARPGSATARPAAGVMARPSTGSHAAPPRGEVSISHWPGEYLESVVLFPEQRLSPAFIQVMNGGAGAEFGKVEF
jgi:CRISPR-associated protein Cmr6